MGKIDVIEYYDDWEVHSQKLTLKVPALAVTTDYHAFKRGVRFSRSNLYLRDLFQCQYCGEQPGTEELSIDHVTPRSHGGLTTWENCVLACVKCNTKKANRTPEQANMKLLKVPRKPRINILRCDFKVKDWETFLGASYWLVELENDC